MCYKLTVTVTCCIRKIMGRHIFLVYLIIFRKCSWKVGHGDLNLFDNSCIVSRELNISIRSFRTVFSNCSATYNKASLVFIFIMKSYQTLKVSIQSYNFALYLGFLVNFTLGYQIEVIWWSILRTIKIWNLLNLFPIFGKQITMREVQNYSAE